MKYTNSILSLITTAALVSATGCSKQESTPAAKENTAASVEKAPVAEVTPKAAAPVTTTAPASVPSPTPIPAPSAVEAKPVSAPANTLQSSFQAQKLAVGRAVTNQVQALAGALTNQAIAALGSTNPASLTLTNPLPPATNQLQALATAATNRALAALGMTNATTTATNQVEALLEKAKILSNNQKYQEALNTVTQLYATKLTPEQKLRADDLKAQIQTALTEKATSGASSALGGLLGGTK